MASNSPLRTVFAVVTCAAIYYVLLGFAYSNAPYTSMPQWWGGQAISKAAALISWFTLLNVVGAALASIPVAFGLVFVGKVQRVGRATIVGLLAALAFQLTGDLVCGHV